MKHCGQVTSSPTCCTWSIKYNTIPIQLTWHSHLQRHTHVYMHTLQCGWSTHMCTDGVPYDGVPLQELVTIHPALTALVSLLVAVGLVFSVVCLVFNIVFRKKKWASILMYCIDCATHTSLFHCGDHYTSPDMPIHVYACILSPPYTYIMLTFALSVFLPKVNYAWEGIRLTVYRDVQYRSHNV